MSKTSTIRETLGVKVVKRTKQPSISGGSKNLSAAIPTIKNSIYSCSIRSFFQQRGSINKNDELVVTSERTRSQHKNLQDTLYKVKAMLNEACHVPKETTEETKVKVAHFRNRENEKRIESKKRKSSLKFDRKNIE